MLVGRRGVGGGGQRGGGWPCCGRKGGKNDNAHASQQGGSGGLVAAETGRAFKNAGDCASHGAQGNDTNGLVLSLRMNPSYACAFGPDCYGTLTGSGPLATSTVKIFYTFLDQPGRPIEVDVKADSSGNLLSQLGLTCPLFGTPLVGAQASGTLAAQNTPVQTSVVNDPCNGG